MAQKFLSLGTPLFKALGVPAMDDNCCCGDPPECPIVWTFEDCQLSWVLVDPPEEPYTVRISHLVLGGSVDEYDNTSSGTIILPGEGTWRATLVIDEIDTANCDIAVSYDEVCECVECSGYLRPAETCVPCGCTRGEATGMVVTIAGAPTEIKNGPWNMSFIVNYTTCFYGTGGCALAPGVHTEAHNSFYWVLGLDVVNGSYAFDLFSTTCSECGAFTCGVSPGGYYIGQFTVEYNATDLPSCHTDYPNDVDHEFLVDVVLSWAPPAASEPYFAASVPCLGSLTGVTSHPLLYARYISPPAGFPTGWLPLSLGSASITDACEYDYDPNATPAVDIDATSDGPINACSEFNGGSTYYPLVNWGALFSPLSAFSYGTTFEVDYTTIGW